ncbi:MAG TPA: TonB-dependent receptor [bacterium]|nr:TonB-dependent receptor [bacterium]HPN43041.1 TonB-dependent receptor [bacterium]
MKQCVFILIALCVLVTNFVFADESGVYVDSVKYKFNPVVVTATKVQGAQKDLAASVSVIDETMIQTAPTHSVLELVKDLVPGINITEKNVMGYGISSGAAGGISIRGVGGSPVTGVLVLRDGRPDIMGMMGHPIPDAYSLDGVERIEVVRGPASFLYGTNAMGGVINIVSKKMTQDGFTTRVSGGLGSFSGKELSGYHGGKIGALEYYVTAATRQTDGHRDYSGYEGDFYTAHIGYDLFKNTNIALNANLSNIYMFDPGTQKSSYVDHWYDIRRSGADLSVVHKSSLGESNLKVHGNFGRHKIYDNWRSNDHTIGVMMYHNIKPIYGNTTTVGFDYKQYGGDAKDSIVKSPMLDYTEQNMTEWAPYIHTQQLLFQRFIVSGGVRIEQHELYGQEVLPKAGLVYHVLSNTSLRASAAKGFRSPAIRELYVMPPRNEKLEPEEMWNYEVGLSQQVGDQINIDACLFRSEGENMIRQVGQRPNIKFLNSKEFMHSGYEIVVNWLPIRHLNLNATWTKLDLEDETAEIPAKKLTLNISYDMRYVNLSANYLRAMDIYGADFHATPMDDYNLVNCAALVKPPIPFISFKISLKNVLDADYETIYGYPMPGRTYMVDMNISL